MAEQPRPAEQVLGDQRELQPGLVVRERVVGQVAHAGVLARPDAVLDAGALVVAHLQRRGVLVGLVGDERGVPVAVLVKDLKLRAWVRPFATDVQSGPLRPPPQFQAAGELGDPRSVATVAVAVDRPSPLVSSWIVIRDLAIPILTAREDVPRRLRHTLTGESGLARDAARSPARRQSVA
jgi:hypothetical protein